MRILMYVIGLAQFLGANPGPAIKDCWYYDHASNSIHAITGIPQPRGGGALIYSPQRHMLIFTAGAGTSACGLLIVLIPKAKALHSFSSWFFMSSPTHCGEIYLDRLFQHMDLRFGSG